MTVWRAFILAAFLASAWLATIEPQRVVISGDDVVSLRVERPAPRYSAPVAAGSYSTSTSVAVPTICTTTVGVAGGTSTIAYATTGVTR